MGADTTQIRITKSLNVRLARISAATNYTKEQIISAFLSECAEAVEETEYSGSPIPSIERLRRAMNKNCPSLEEFIRKNIRSVIDTEYSQTFLPEGKKHRAKA